MKAIVMIIFLINHPKLGTTHISRKGDIAEKRRLILKLAMCHSSLHTRILMLLYGIALKILNINNQPNSIIYFVLFIASIQLIVQYFPKNIIEYSYQNIPPHTILLTSNFFSFPCVRYEDFPADVSQRWLVYSVDTASIGIQIFSLLRSAASATNPTHKGHLTHRLESYNWDTRRGRKRNHANDNTV